MPYICYAKGRWGGLQKVLDDPFRKYIGIVNFRLSYGWYGGAPEDFSKIGWDIANKKTSSRRPQPGIQDGWNRKGIIGENGQKKTAFKVLQEYYQRVEKQ